MKKLFFFVLICAFCLGLTIDDQPTSYTQIDEGSSTTLTVSASSDSEILYQWSYNYSPIYDATSNTYTIPYFYKENEGFYSCLVSDDTVSSNTDGTTITLNMTVPVILSQSTNMSILLGETSTLSVSSTGGSLKYQWFKNYRMADGATSVSQSYIIGPAVYGDKGYYYCRVYNSKGRVNSTKIRVRIITE